MTLYRPNSVDLEPDVILSDWAVFSVPFKAGESCHFVGFNELTQDGRVSSPIVSYDKEKKIGVTRSGRTYKLDGRIHLNGDATYVWNNWLKMYENYIDQTKEVENISYRY